MKKILAGLLCLLMLAMLIPSALAEPDDRIVIDSTTFPDDVFRVWVRNGGNANEITVKKSGSTYYIPKSAADALDTLDCSGKGIQSAKGIEYFPNLVFLALDGNKLTELDLSGNPKIKILRVGGNKLTKLNVTGLKSLVSLGCDNNRIKSLNLKYCKKLETLEANHNKLTSIDLSKNAALLTLDLRYNDLKKLDVGKNPLLSYLDVGINTKLTSLDVSKNAELRTLYCDCDDLDTLDVSKLSKLEELYCSSIFLRKLDVTKNTKLKKLSCGENRLTSLDVSKNTALEELHCGDNLLTELDVKNCGKLKEFACENNFLEQLDVSTCADLEILDCSNNEIRFLNVTYNTKLRELECFCNRIWSIGGIKNCTKLKMLHCNDNEMTALPLTGLTKLTDLALSPQAMVTYADVVESGGVYTFNMNALFETGSEKLNVVAYDASYSYNKSTGIMTLPEKVTEFPYLYDTGAGLMEVVVKTPHPGTPTVQFSDGAVEYKGTTPYVVYSGLPMRPPVTVYDQNGKRIDPIYYEVKYENNTKPGTAKAVVRMKGTNKTGSAWFKIYLPPTDATTVVNVQNGIQISWNPVEDAKGYVIYRRAWNLVDSGWTTFERWNNTTKTTWTDTKVYAGTRYQYGVKAYFSDPMDNYNLGIVGPLKTTVRITTRTLLSVTPGSKKLTVKWAGSKVFTGYEVQVATDAAFTKDVKTVTVKKATTYETAVKSLKAKTTYYVRVRSYHVFEGMTYYGQWSNVLTGKTK